ncbi:MAG: flagellar motor switch protein FliN [bacterium]|nr:flagellar motor switch protein FliN [bacterium]
MSDGSLSQEEINALLQGVDEVVPDTTGGLSSPGMTAGDQLGEQEKQSFLNIIKDQLPTAANTISTIITKKVTFSNFNLEMKSSVDVRSEMIGEFLQVKIDYTEGISGDVLFVFKKQDAAVVADLMVGQDGSAPPIQLNDLYLSALGEAVSQINSAGITIFSEKLNRIIKTSPPKVEVVTDPGKLMLPSGTNIIKITSTFQVEGLINSTMIQFFPISLVKEVIPGAAAPVSYEMSKQPMAGPAMTSAAMPMPQQVKVQQAQFPSLNVQGISAEQAANIQLLMDVPMQLTVELGRARMLVKEILGLGEGSIIELDKLAGEPVDLLVNNKLIAKGEVVVIDENFGVRVTDIINPMERLIGLQDKK